MNIRPLGILGARVEDVDLSQPLNDADAKAIVRAFHEHHLLVMSGQDLGPADQVRFTELLGEAVPHPLSTRRTLDDWPQVLILENRPGRRGAPNDYWHSDISHSPRPPLATVLHARTVPEGRGDTQFCDMCAAWDTLSDGLRETIRPLRAVHSGAATVARAAAEKTDALPIAEVPEPSLHPVVRHIPETGRDAVFVNPHFTVSFEDMTEAESAPLLGVLVEHATRPENLYRHRWTAGDLLVWDNRAVMHYAVRDYSEDMPRLMHRTTAAGDVPMAAGDAA